MSRAPKLQLRDGFSIVEVLVGMSLLSLVMMGLAGSATLGLAQMAKARQDLAYSADVQQLSDSLVAKGSCTSASGQTWGQTCGNNLVNGSATIRGRSLAWTVTNVNAKSYTRTPSRCMSRTPKFNDRASTGLSVP
jgi:prepilin-type N-terminal cleavage/methylation domain-containing protein